MTFSTLLMLIGFILVIGILLYNSLVQKRIATENAWSQINVQLKRRHDLIPNLVETVRGYATHERETLEKVTKARATAVSAEQAGVKQQAEAENMLSGALRQLLALSENYPDLKANTSFATLQEEISSTENRIGFARQHYNDSVSIYNTALQTVPTNFVARFGTFPLKEFFELSETEQAQMQSAPKISF